MRLITDISEEDYKECKFRKDLLSLGGEPTDLTFNMRIETAIANGTPLEEELKKIKAEIIKGKCKYCDIDANIQKCLEEHDSLCDVCDIFVIIDNYIKELKGEKE